MSFFVNIPMANDQTFIIREYKANGQDYPYHYHREYELTLVLKSHGDRLIGDHLEPYQPWDLVLLGPNLPHQWKKDPAFKVPGGKRDHIFVLNFREDFFGQSFLTKMETQALKQLLEQAKLGLVFTPSTAQEIAPTMEKLLHHQSLKGLIYFLELFDQLCKATPPKQLASPGFLKVNDQKGRDKITKIVRYILDNIDLDITASKAAEIAEMRPSTFSHYFKKRTTKSFIKYVNEIRLGHASRLLADTDLSISEICYRSGFRNLSNFNRQFKRQYGLAPLRYRKHVLA